MDHNYKYPYSHAISGLFTCQSWILILVVQVICNCSVDFSCVQGSVVLRMKFAVKLLKKNASMDSTKTMLLINGSPFLEIQLRHARNRSLRWLGRYVVGYVRALSLLSCILSIYAYGMLRPDHVGRCTDIYNFIPGIRVALINWGSPYRTSYASQLPKLVYITWSLISRHMYLFNHSAHQNPF